MASSCKNEEIRTFQCAGQTEVRKQIKQTDSLAGGLNKKSSKKSSKNIRVNFFFQLSDKFSSHTRDLRFAGI